MEWRNHGFKSTGQIQKHAKFRSRFEEMCISPVGLTSISGSSSSSSIPYTQGDIGRIFSFPAGAGRSMKWQYIVFRVDEA